MTVLNESASIFFRQRFPTKICFAMLVYLQHAIFILQNILKRKSKLTSIWSSKIKGFQLPLKNSSNSDHFLNVFEPSCTPSEISGQSRCNFLLLFFISVAFAAGDTLLAVTKVSGGSISNNFKLLILGLFAFWVSLPSTELCWQSFHPPPQDPSSCISQIQCPGDF